MKTTLRGKGGSAAAEFAPSGALPGAAGDGTGEGSPGKCGTAQRGGGRTPARDSSLGSGRNVHDRRRDARLAQFVLTDCPAWAGWAGLVTVCGEHLVSGSVGSPLHRPALCALI